MTFLELPEEPGAAGCRESCCLCLALTLLPLFQLIHPTEENLQELCKPALLQRLLKIESLPLLWLVLRGLVLLSERPETVSRT